MIKIIDNDREYKKALNRIEEIFNAEPGTEEFEELRVLSLLIETYEKEKSQLGEADPIELIKFKLDQLELSHKDLEEVIGNRSHVWKILNYKVSISKINAARLSKFLNLPIELLLQPYNLKKTIQSKNDPSGIEIPILSKSKSPKPPYKKEFEDWNSKLNLEGRLKRSLN